MKIEYFNAYDSYVEIGLTPETMEDQAKLVHLGMGNRELNVTVCCNGTKIDAHISGRRRHRSQRSTQIKLS